MIAFGDTHEDYLYSRQAMNMISTKVACVCPTYGRLGFDFDHTSLLCESVEAFLRQTYCNKELLIINDTPGQIIKCDEPDVTVVNVEKRFTSIGAKRNFAIEMAKDAEIVVVWDDDDISLPRRIELAVRSLTEPGPPRCYLGEQITWTSINNEHYELIHHGPPGLTASAYYFRDAAIDVPYQDSSYGEDHALHHDMHRTGKSVGGVVREPKDACLIYRWGGLPRHVSSFPPHTGYQKLGEIEYPKTEITIKPFWLYDYQAKCDQLVADGLDKR